MQNMSEKYKRIVGNANKPWWTNLSIAIGDLESSLVNEDNYIILFGGVAIQTDEQPEGAYLYNNSLFSVKTHRSLFASSSPTIGNAISGEIDIDAINPDAAIPRMAKMEIQIQVDNGDEQSEWFNKGIYFLDNLSS